MKRWIALVLTASMVCTLAGCKSSDPETQPEPTEQPPIQTLITPVPTLQPTAVPFSANIGSGETVAELAEEETGDDLAEVEQDLPEETETTAQLPEEDPYIYSSLTNQTLLVRIIYPEGWISDPSTDTITMVQPVAEGEVPARFSVTSFEYTYRDRDITSARLKGHLTDFLKTVVAPYNEYQIGVTGADIKFSESTPIYAKYIAVKGNAFIEGIALVGYGKNGRVYCMHFCCEQDDFEANTPLMLKLAENVTPVTSSK